ncbi:MAG TPA: ATP-binding protein [Xanthobacteraceae bacterium]|nr:ATP-binding protein [Xanthobacteraceae bacterium]
MERTLQRMRSAATPGGAGGVLAGLGLVAAVTLILEVVKTFIELPPIAITYLIPVLIAAIRWGYLSAMVTTIAGGFCSAFFFYKPTHTIFVEDPARRLSLMIFAIVAVVAAHLAVRMRRESEVVLKREKEINDLYAFSRRLAAGHSTSEIFDAIQRHLSTVVGRRVALFEPRRPAEGKPEPIGESDVPQNVRAEVTAVLAGHATAGMPIADHQGNLWLVRAVSRKAPDLGVIAIDLGRQTPESEEEIRARIEAVLHDAASTLEQLGLAHAITEVRMRAESERFRDALIGSVSHELRTPLSSILGAATVLRNAPAVAGDPRLVALANVVHDESERLNNEIQNLLDATRISGEALHPKLEWAEVADVVNTALERRRGPGAAHAIDVDLPAKMPLVQVDAVLIEKALGQILANAVKYSPPGSRIKIRGWQEGGVFALSVSDQGAGLSPEDTAHLGERFFRGRRHVSSTPGSGLGFWIANAFVAANGGTIEADSSGEDKGTTVTIRLPIPANAEQLESISSD